MLGIMKHRPNDEVTDVRPEAARAEAGMSPRRRRRPRKLRARVALAALGCALVTAAGVGLAQPASASPPPNAYASFEDSVVVETFGLDPAVCFDKDYNPLGYIKYYTLYDGLSYYASPGMIVVTYRPGLARSPTRYASDATIRSAANRVV